MKPRFVGFDDGFTSLKESSAHLVGCVTAGCRVEGFMYTGIEVDGLDVSEKIVELILSSKFRNQISCIFLYGITFAGMNVADIEKIARETGRAVVSVVKRKSSIERLVTPAKKASKKPGDFERRMEILRRAGEPLRLNNVYVHFSGCSAEDARMYLKLSTCIGKIPECLRIAHLVASALAYGESKKS